MVEDKKDPEGPKNANGQYAGSVSIKTAVEKSINTVAWSKFNELGAETAMQYLLEMTLFLEECADSKEVFWY